MFGLLLLLFVTGFVLLVLLILFLSLKGLLFVKTAVFSFFVVLSPLYFVYNLSQVWIAFILRITGKRQIKEH